LAAALEQELGIPIVDSVATAVWGSLRLAGVDTRRVTGWGGIFAVGDQGRESTGGDIGR
jgi:maleate isomerase